VKGSFSAELAQASEFWSEAGAILAEAAKPYLQIHKIQITNTYNHTEKYSGKLKFPEYWNIGIFFPLFYLKVLTFKEKICMSSNVLMIKRFNLQATHCRTMNHHNRSINQSINQSINFI